ncbi:MAG: serine/threonine-protein kinase [Bryobacteraceae bacterium]
MTPQERWRRVQDLYETLEPLAPAEREAELSGVDPGLAEEVRGLFAGVAAEAQAQQALNRVASASKVVAPKPELPGLRLLDPIGSGGSGVVYRAIRHVEGVEQPVAVKVLHEHRIEPTDLRRFARERKMMAALNHPGVVRFLDAGVIADGRPYLVMELVDGTPIDVYCDQRRLRVESRVRLMIDVCDVVAAAHARLIVHLDLKPSNILVTAEGKIKLLDLGTARLLNADGISTVTQQMTPRYASPEQLRSESPAVSNDVYSLGIILFELLSGGWPFALRDSLLAIAERAADAAAIRNLSEGCSPESAALRDTTVTRLRGELAGDLTLICQQALAFDPQQRYKSVAELAGDLRRHLSGEPVLAHPPGLLYRAGKFIARRRWQLALALLFVAGLAGAAAYSTIQARRTQLALNQADTTTVALILAMGVADAGSKPNRTLLEFLQDTSAHADAYVSPKDPAVRSDFDASLAYGLIAQQDYKGARAVGERALAFAHQSGDVSRRAAAQVVMANVEYNEGHMDKAFAGASEAFRLWKANQWEFTPARTWNLLWGAGIMLQFSRPSDPAGAELFAACLQHARAGDPAAARFRAVCSYGMGIVHLTVTFDYDGAIPLLQESAAYWRSTGQPTMLARVLQALGWAYRYSGRYTEDEAYQRQALELLRQSETGSLNDANLRAVWAASLALSGRAKQGMEESLKALAVYRKSYPKRGDSWLWTALSAAFMNAYALGNYDDCAGYAREGLEAVRYTAPSFDARRALANSYLGLCLSKLGKDAEAKPLLEASLTAFDRQKRKPYMLSAIQAELARMK